MPEHVFILLLSGSQRHDLDRILAQLVHHIGYQVKSLLICQSGYNAYHHHLIILLQPQFLLESQLVLYLLSPEIIHRVVLLNKRISGRVVLLIINTVHNT